MTHSSSPRIGLVCAANNVDILNRRLLASPCLANATLPVFIAHNPPSAAVAYDHARLASIQVDWWVWVHQDVYLPLGWLDNFTTRLAEAMRRWPNLSVVSSYGLTADGRRAGRLLDRGLPLLETEPLPCLVQAFDEHLIAIRKDAGLAFDPLLGFDLYGTDIALTACKCGYQAAVLDLYCEHWSGTPKLPPFPDQLVERFRKSAVHFEQKWQEELPIHTPCMSFTFPGSAAEQCRKLSEGL